MHIEETREFLVDELLTRRLKNKNELRDVLLICKKISSRNDRIRNPLIHAINLHYLYLAPQCNTIRVARRSLLIAIVIGDGESMRFSSNKRINLRDTVLDCYFYFVAFCSYAFENFF